MAENAPILLQKDNTFTKLFVGGLPYHTTDETLRAYFSQHGDIEEAVVIYDRNSKKSKGYGFVTMATKDGAESACVNPNPIVDGRKANVNLAYIGAKPKSHSQPSSPMDLATAGRSDSPAGGIFHSQSPSTPLPLGLQAQGFFMTPPPPGYYENSPPFSPPPVFPLMYPPYYTAQYPGPAISGMGYIPPPQVNTNQVLSPMLPYNVAN